MNRPKTQAPNSHDPYADFFRVELALSSTLADVAETNFRIGHQESGKSALRKAQVGYATLRRYLASPAHASHLTEDEKQEISEGTEQLRTRVEMLLQGRPGAET